jgi:hypothetical protein
LAVAAVGRRLDRRVLVLLFAGLSAVFGRVVRKDPRTFSSSGVWATDWAALVAKSAISNAKLKAFNFIAKLLLENKPAGSSCGSLVFNTNLKNDRIARSSGRRQFYCHERLGSILIVKFGRERIRLVPGEKSSQLPLLRCV